MKKVKLIDVARAARVHSGTVSKILNNWPHDSFDEATRQKVLKIARRLGYLHPRVVKSDRRSAPRKKSKVRALIKVCLEDGRTFSQLKGEVVNISATGMLLTSISGKKKVLPLEPFYLEIDIISTKKQFPKLKALPIRFARMGKARASTGSKLALGVQFIKIPKGDEFLKLLEEFAQNRNSRTPKNRGIHR